MSHIANCVTTNSNPSIGTSPQQMLESNSEKSTSHITRHDPLVARAVEWRYFTFELMRYVSVTPENICFAAM